MPKFLIDANLPYRFSLWHDEDFIHLKNIDDGWSDKKVWGYARENNMTIITKDADFSARMILAKPPPKVIHLRIGNMKMNDLHSFLNKNWKNILAFHQVSKLVNVYNDRIEAIQ